MKLLRDLLYRVKLDQVSGQTNVAVETLTFDSRNKMKFGLFIAIRGGAFDGHKFIGQAIEKGAIAIVCEEFPEEINQKVTYVKVEDARLALGEIASNFYDHPSEEIQIIGITGTNGKTSIATLMHQLIKGLGKKAGLISTIVNRIGDLEIPTKHTTPDPIQLNSLLRQMVNNDCDYCFMEVSSHAVAQHRIKGIKFAGGVFTNLTHDHLDYHKDFNDYLMAKKYFFDSLGKEAFALINDDDKYGEKMASQIEAKLYTYALNTEADFKAKILENRFDGMLVNIDMEEVWIKLIGKFNAYNVLAVYAVASLLHFNKLDILKILSSLNPVEGRFQFLQSQNKISAIIDYAHTPDALQKVLETIKEIRSGKESVITVVGCGGNRDKAKRPLMAEISAKLSDKVILTSDNPRNENPNEIIDEMFEGISISKRPNTLKITDRKEAIRTACALAKEGDIVLVAGKGHEKYQEINGERFPFDDMKVLKETLK